MSKAYIGTSGYIYDHWYGVFYPEDLTKDKWLEHYCQFFDTVELNVTFYRLPFEAAFKGWYKRTPENFLFTVKGSRFITHIKKLNDPKEPVKLLFDRAKHLKEKLGMILWQLPPGFKANLDRLEDFCKLLKKDYFKEEKDYYKKDYYKNSLERKNVIRHSFEFREESWFCEDVYQILKRYNMALVICDYPFQLAISEKRQATEGRKQIQVPETADFIYLRRHGATALYSSNYSDNQLKEDAQQIKKWLKKGKDVYVYFNNDAYGYAVKNALKLKELIRKE